ncbi:MAG: vanadium-dependent haloperoxidase [Myxococcota bacterium]
MNLRRQYQPVFAATAGALALGVVATVLPLSAHEAQPTTSSRQPAPTSLWCAEACDAVITDWSLNAYHVVKAADGYQDPMAASRALAMMHVAMHDAVNAVRGRYQPYAFVPRAPASDADPAVAAVVAAHDVLASLYPQPAALALLKTQLESSLFDAGIGPAVERGKELGKAAAAAVLSKRSNDGSTRKETYVVRNEPGQYQYTPPFDFAAAPHWRKVTPFALTSPAQFRSDPPPTLTSDEYRRDYDEVKRVGAKNAGSARTPDETHYAAFWYEFSDIGWNRVARVVSTRVDQDLWERARTFALLNMALADSYIAGWDSKYLYNSWRPLTAIQRAAEDGNTFTSPDPKFETLLITPPVPDMPSTHSVLGMAAATVLAHSFGTDHFPFSFASPSANPENPVRSFKSFSEAARENADSRVKAGLHFRYATRAGLEMGKRIGEHVTRNALKRRPH